VSGQYTTVTAVATDRAGNVARSGPVRYRTLTAWLSGATYANGAFQVRSGQAYTLTALAGTRPVYYDAARAPGTPMRRDKAMLAAGPGRWNLGIRMGGMRSGDWNLGVKIGTTMVIVRVHVR
jgi:hypothetical protein